MQQNFLISANPFVQRAGIAALEKGGPAVERMRQIYDRRRQAMPRRGILHLRRRIEVDR